jgi:hypothetical protein
MSPDRTLLPLHHFVLKCVHDISVCTTYLKMLYPTPLVSKNSERTRDRFVFSSSVSAFVDPGIE